MGASELSVWVFTLVFAVPSILTSMLRNWAVAVDARRRSRTAAPVALLSGTREWEKEEEDGE